MYKKLMFIVSALLSGDSFLAMMEQMTPIKNSFDLEKFAGMPVIYFLGDMKKQYGWISNNQCSHTNSCRDKSIIVTEFGYVLIRCDLLPKLFMYQSTLANKQLFVRTPTTKQEFLEFALLIKSNKLCLQFIWINTNNPARVLLSDPDAAKKLKYECLEEYYNKMQQGIDPLHEKVVLFNQFLDLSIRLLALERNCKRKLN